MGEFFDWEYTDVQADDQTWKVGKVQEKNKEHGTYVKFVDLEETHACFITSQARLAKFRTKTRGNAWPEGGFDSPPNFFYEDELKQFQELKRKLTSNDRREWLSANDILKGIRGDFYFAVATVMQDSVSTALLPHALCFLREYASLLLWWLQWAPERIPAITEVLLRADAAYDSVECAKASLWPELFDAFSLICRVNPKTKSQFYKKAEDQVRALEAMLAREGVDSLEELFLMDFVQQGGLEALTALMESL